MSSQIRIVKEKLNLAITQLCETSWMFVKNPNRDFTRERELPLREVISILLCMEGGSLTGELLRYFRCSRYSPSGSAFIQQRQKINEFAFPSLFSLFVTRFIICRFGLFGSNYLIPLMRQSLQTWMQNTSHLKN